MPNCKRTKAFSSDFHRCLDTQPSRYYSRDSSARQLCRPSESNQHGVASTESHSASPHSRLSKGSCFTIRFQARGYCEISRNFIDLSFKQMPLSWARLGRDKCKIGAAKFKVRSRRKCKLLIIKTLATQFAEQASSTPHANSAPTSVNKRTKTWFRQIPFSVSRLR